MSSSLTTRLCLGTHQVTKLYEAHGLEAPMTMCRKYMATYMDIQSRHSKDPVVWYPPSALFVVHFPLLLVPCDDHSRAVSVARCA